MDVGSKQLSKQAILQNASAMKPHNTANNTKNSTRSTKAHNHLIKDMYIYIYIYIYTSIYIPICTIYNEDPHQRAQKLSLTRNVRLLEAPAAFFPKDLPHGSVKISPSCTAMYVHTLYIIYNYSSHAHSLIPAYKNQSSYKPSYARQSISARICMHIYSGSR